MSSSEFSDAESGDDGYGARPFKRRKQSKEDRMLGVFGSDSEDDGPRRFSDRTLHNRGVDFKRAGTISSDEDDFRPSFGRPDREPSTTESPREPPVHQTIGEPFANSSEDRARPAVPVFGMFRHDGGEAFVPKANPCRSTQTPYVDIAPSGSFRPERSSASFKAAPERKMPPSRLQSGKAARMMAMMGYKAGEGLGTSGNGIVQPIEAKLRPGQKSGLGSVDEKNSSESSHRHAKSLSTPRTQSQTKEAQTRKIKVRYKTAKEIVDEAGGGLSIPQGLKSILDMTGSKTKRIAGLENLESTSFESVHNDSYRLFQIARRDVERFAANWRTLQDRKAYLAAEVVRIRAELDHCTSQILSFRALNDSTHALIARCEETHDDETKLARLFTGLSTLEIDVQEQQPGYRLDELVVSLLAPHLKHSMSFWLVLEEPSKFYNELSHLGTVLQLSKLMENGTDIDTKRAAYPFECLMATIWYPRIRQSISTSWTDLADPAVLRLLEVWNSLTPQFLHEQIVDQLLMPRLTACIQKWNPRSRHEQSSLSWLFQWLPYVGTRVGILVQLVKRKFVTVLSHWRPSHGLILELFEWDDLIGKHEISSMLEKQVLPKLEETLRKELVIEPSDQQLAVLDSMLLWQPKFTPQVMAELLATEFFPKWTNVLYLWLKANGDFEEISEWYEWWRRIIPAALMGEKAVQKGFAKGLEMMEIVLENGAEALPVPDIGPKKPLDHQKHLREQKESVSRRQASVDVEIPEITFKDVVEDWCSKHNYLLFPLRKAHESGNALFKITGNATGTGGITVYLRGDIVMVLGADKSHFKPTRLADIAMTLR